MNTPSQDACNRNNGRGPPQQYRPFHPYKNRRNNNFKQNNNFRNNRFNGPGDGTNEMNPNNFSPQGFSSPIVRNAGGGGGEHFNNYRNNRNGGNGNYRNDGYKNRKNFTPFKTNAEEYDVRKYFHMSMIQDPWAECTKQTEFVFANEPTDDDLASDLVDDELDAQPDMSRSPDTAAATADDSGDDDD